MNMSFEEWWESNKRFFVGASIPAIDLAKVAWQAGYKSALDGWVNNKSKEE